MVYWGSGPGMVQEPELEEGEACDYKDDSRIDPDIALSYIGDKVQSILGHLQKDFEGGVTAENLGAKFGGYGSFLPMHQRSPPVWSQPKSPPRVRTPNLPGSPNHFLSDKERNKSIPVHTGPVLDSVAVPDAPSTRRTGLTSPPCVHPPQTSKVASGDASIRQHSSLTSDRAAEALPGKVDLSSRKSDNPKVQRPLKFRIRLGPERFAQYDALGLTSSCSSAENSSEESGGVPVESSEIQNESPVRILQIMTSSPVAGAMLLSPLREDLLNIVKETGSSVENVHESGPKSFAITDNLLKTDICGGKKTETAGDGQKSEKSENKHDEKKSRSRPVVVRDSDEKCLTDTVRRVEKDVQVKRESKDRMRSKAAFGDSLKTSSLEHSSDQSCSKHEQRDIRCESVEKVVENRAKVSQKDIIVKSSGSEKNASSKAHPGISEAKKVKGALNNLSPKVGRQPASGEQDGLGTPHAVNNLSFEKKLKGSPGTGKLAPKLVLNSRDGDCALPKTKLGGKNVHVGKKDVSVTSSVYMENTEPLLERPSSGSLKDSYPERNKTKSSYADKLKERSSSKRYRDDLSSQKEPLVAAISSSEGAMGALEQIVAPVSVVNEDWVGCDICQKWRLLPYGRTSAEFPGKWICSMLDWLPGMNRCDVSEEATTKAVQASYPLNTVPQYYQVNADRIISGVSSADANHFDQNQQHFTSDRVASQVKKQKINEKQNTVGMRNAVPSKGKTSLKRRALQSESSKELSQSPAGGNAKSKFNLQLSNDSAAIAAKVNKRKDEHVVGDDDEPVRKKLKRQSLQEVDGVMTKSKGTGKPNLDNSQKPGRNPGASSQGLASGISNKLAVEVEHGPTSLGMGKIQIHLKKPKDGVQEHPDKGALGKISCNGSETETVKRKSKDYEDGQHQAETLQNNGSNLQCSKVTMKGQKDGDLHREKKSQLSHFEETEVTSSKVEDVSKTKGVESRVRLLQSKEYPTSRAIETEQQARKLRIKAPLTLEDIDKLRKDLGCEQISTVATSSSSKVSDTRKNRIYYREVRNSPAESVTSSPARIPYPNHVSPEMMETEANNSRLDYVPLRSNMKKAMDTNGCSEAGIVRKGKTTGVGCAGSSGNRVLDFRETDNVLDQRSPCPTKVLLVNPGRNKGGLCKDESDAISSLKDSRNNLARSSVKKISVKKEHENLHQEDRRAAPCSSKSGLVGSLKRSSMDAKPSDASVIYDTPKSLKDRTIACSQSGFDEFIIRNEAERSGALDANLTNKDVTDVTASTSLKKAEDVLREAEDLRVHADLIKNSGFGSESNYEYFKAALKFLQGASALEACNGGSSKHMEMNPMQIYGTAARLCKTCASEYEKGHEMAAAALAYKCLEVAYMRVVYFKSSMTQRVCHDLQSSLQMVSQGESPSSSASDVDNLNNSQMADKTALSKGNVSHSGNQVIVPRNNSNFIRLLDFTRDVSSAMEAAKKSQDMFAAARVELEDSRNKEAFGSIKKVIDFSFQDVEELTRLIWYAFSTINRQGLGG